MITELGIGIETSISGLALIAFWKRALHIFLFNHNNSLTCHFIHLILRFNWYSIRLFHPTKAIYLPEWWSHNVFTVTASKFTHPQASVRDAQNSWTCLSIPLTHLIYTSTFRRLSIWPYWLIDILMPCRLVV